MCFFILISDFLQNQTELCFVVQELQLLQRQSWVNRSLTFQWFSIYWVLLCARNGAWWCGYKDQTSPALLRHVQNKRRARLRWQVSQAGSWNWEERPEGVLLGNCSNAESTSKATLCSPHSFCCVPVGQSGLRSAHFHPLPHGCVLMGLPAFTWISVTS